MKDSNNNGYNSSVAGNPITSRKHFNLLLLVGVLAGTIVGFLIGEVLIATLERKISDVLLVGIYFAQLMFFIFLAVLICEKIDSRLNTRFWTKNHWNDSLKRLPLMSILAFFILGCILQFIYGLAPAKTVLQKADDYIIAIDNSGSTSNTDPNKDRFSSLNSFMNDLNESNQATVIVFSDKADVAVDLGKVDEKFRQDVKGVTSKFDSNGGTNIQDALLKAADMCADPKRTFMVILLSDGESSVDIHKVIDKYNQKQIILNTVGYSFNRFMGTQLLVKLSSLTGGMNYDISDMQQLSGTLSKILTEQTHGRSLLGYRYGFDRNSVLFMILRWLFIAMITVAICFAMGYMLYTTEVILRLLPQKIVMGIAAGAIVEFGLQSFMQELMLRLLMVLLMGLMILFYKTGSLLYANMGMNATLQDSSSDQGKIPLGVGGPTEW